MRTFPRSVPTAGPLMGLQLCTHTLWVSNSHPMLPRDGSEITAAERHSWGELSEASTAPATPRPGCC